MPPPRIADACRRRCLLALLSSRDTHLKPRPRLNAAPTPSPRCLADAAWSPSRRTPTSDYLTGLLPPPHRSASSDASSPPPPRAPLPWTLRTPVRPRPSPLPSAPYARGRRTDRARGHPRRLSTPASPSRPATASPRPCLARAARSSPRTPTPTAPDSRTPCSPSPLAAAGAFSGRRRIGLTPFSPVPPRPPTSWPRSPRAHCHRSDAALLPLCPERPLPQCPPPLRPLRLPLAGPVGASGRALGRRRPTGAAPAQAKPVTQTG